MQKAFIVFLLTFITTRLFIYDQVTNDTAIERRGTRLELETRQFVINNCNHK